MKHVLPRSLQGLLRSLAAWPNLFAIAACTVLVAAAGRVEAQKIVTLQNGMELEGQTAKLGSLGDDVLNPAGGGAVNVQLIVMVDDGMRRTFVSSYQVDKQGVRPAVEVYERIFIDKNRKSAVPPGSNRLGSIGGILGVSPFDEWGRRTFSMMSPKGRMDIIQGITELTPNWARVQSLRTSSGAQYAWDMRIATSSIPKSVVAKILEKQSNYNPDDSNLRLSIVRLYLQAKRYGDAEEELSAAIRDFPELEDLNDLLKELGQLRSKQQLDELKLRQSVGQHAMVRNLIAAFPNQDVAGEILLEVSELSDKYSDQDKQAKSLVTSLEAQIASLEAEQHKQIFASFMEELTAELGYDSLPRLADYLRLKDDNELQDGQKLSLALSGWLLAGTGTENIAVATSLWKVRDLIEQYLQSESPAERAEIVAELASQEGGSPRYVSQLLNGLRPPKRTTGLNDRWLPAKRSPALPKQIVKPLEPSGTPREIPGMFEIEVPGLRAGQSFKYVVQLPPSYNSYRRYPAVVTLHGAGSSPEMQLQWWTGGYNERLQRRLGQASRHGTIVIAPAWAEYRQKRYGFTATEHAKVFNSLRDALQRFSIDSDRVYLSGHSMGGDAAWDIGLAHPDLWAGVMPISALATYDSKHAPNYITRYWKNVSQVPFYFVRGGLDRPNVDTNSMDFNRYFKKSGINAMLVEYRGRGHEHFQDEIQRMFTWMKLHTRDFARAEFKVDMMRPWDNFYWWLELDEFPKATMILPAEWGNRPPPRRPMTVTGDIREKKNVFVKTGNTKVKVTVLLNPDLVDLDNEVTIRVNGRVRKSQIVASSEVILEDARQRGDRKHPFWVKVDPPPIGKGKR